MNFDKDISKWQVKTVNDQNQEVGKEGNVVFFRDDEGELRSGILVEFNDLKNDVKIIQGDVDNRVQEVNVTKEKVIAYLDDEVKIEEEDTPLAGGEEEKEDNNKEESSESEEVETLTKTATDAEGTVEVTATYQSTAKIPEEAEFRVTKLENSENGNARYDIGFYAGNKEVEPETPVSISIKHLDMTMGSNMEVDYIHYKNDGTTEEIKSSISESEDGKLVSSITTSSFSTFELEFSETIFVKKGDSIIHTIKNQSNSTMYYQLRNNDGQWDNSMKFSVSDSSNDKSNTYAKIEVEKSGWWNNYTYTTTITGKEAGVTAFRYSSSQDGSYKNVGIVVMDENEDIIEYNVNNKYSDPNPIPTIQGKNKILESIILNDGEVYYVKNPDILMFKTGNDHHSVSYRFDGWIVNDDSEHILAPGTYLSKNDLEKYKNSNGVISLKANWIGDSNKTVEFYVNIRGSVVDYGVSPVNDTSKKEDYTSAVHVTSLSLLDANTKKEVETILENDIQKNPMYIGFQSTVEKYNTPNKADAEIRSLVNGYVDLSKQYPKDVNDNYAGDWPNQVKVKFNSFPSDEETLVKARTYQKSAIAENKIKDETGNSIPVEELNSENFTVVWYMFRGTRDRNWHVDGALVRKTAYLTVQKTFYGNEEAINAVKNGFYIQVINTTDSDDLTKLTLDFNDGSTDDLIKGKGGQARPTKVSEDGLTYTWVIPQVAKKQYIVTEHDYTAKENVVDGVDMATVSQYVVSGSNGVTEGRKFYTSSGIQIDSKTYYDSVPWQNYQTVHLYNSYIPSNHLLITKVGDYGMAIQGVQFQLFKKENNEEKLMEIFQDSQGVYYIYSDGTEGLNNVEGNVLTTNASGFIDLMGLKDSKADGEYILKEISPIDGYDPIKNIVLKVENGEISLDSQNDQVKFENNNLIITNTSKKINVTVKKEWQNDTTQTSVKVQLLRNGTAVPGSEVELSESIVNKWTHTWTDLPSSMQGKPIDYTVRETWIGDLAYDSSADSSDGFAEYTVTYTNPVKDADGNISMIVRNANAKLGLEFYKRDGKTNDRLKGATFQLYEDENCKKEFGQPVTSDVNGYVSFGTIRPGIFYMREIAAPEGYELSSTIYKIEVDSRGRATIKPLNGGPAINFIENTLKKATLIIAKVDNNNKPLAGAEFTLSKKDDPSFEDVVKTSVGNGSIIFDNLGEGHYILKETKAPDGYNLLTKVYEFKVDKGSISFIGEQPKEYNPSIQTLKVVNDAGQALPNTGGTGTKLFTFSGGAIIAASSLMYGYKKRQKGKKKGGIQ